MLYSKPNLQKFLWAEAMNTAAYIINRTGHTKKTNKSPHELWHGKTPVIENFRIFGTECFVHIPAEKRRKLDRKTIKGFLVGYVDDNKGYRIYVPSVRDVILSRDVIFKPEQVMSDIISIDLPNDRKDVCVISDDSTSYNAENEDEIEREVEINHENKRELRDRRIIKPPEFYGCPVTFLAEKVPLDYDEAMRSEEKDLWRQAMHDEINSLHENETWVLVKRPENQKVINSRWVFSKKLNSNNAERYKARLVVKGYAQKEGILKRFSARLLVLIS